MKWQRKCLAQTCYRGRRPPEAEIKRSVVLVVTAFLAEKRLLSCRPVFLQKGPRRAKKLQRTASSLKPMRLEKITQP